MNYIIAITILAGVSYVLCYTKVGRDIRNFIVEVLNSF